MTSSPRPQEVSSHAGCLSCFSDKEPRDCFSFKLLSGEASSLKPGHLCITKQLEVRAKRVNQTSRHRDESPSVGKGQLCCSCQARRPRSLEGHVLAHWRPQAVWLSLETHIREEKSWLWVLAK